MEPPRGSNRSETGQASQRGPSDSAPGCRGHSRERKNTRLNRSALKSKVANKNGFVATCHRCLSKGHPDPASSRGERVLGGDVNFGIK